MHDILSDTWVFQEIIKEGLEKGEKKGLDIGKKEGLGEALLQIVELRFPTLLTQAKQTVEQQTSVEQMRTMFSNFCRANTLEEAKTVLQVQEMEQ